MTQSLLLSERQIFIDELTLLQNKNPNEFADIISDVGFECNCCGRCCTAGYNGHVFLLDSDYEQAIKIEPKSCIPAPFFEICDNEGTFYVSGYALRIKPDGSCIFLENNRCRIYNDRFTICRVYPYMMHREADEKGQIDFRQISGLNEHGNYNVKIERSDATKIGENTLAYEEAYLKKMIQFYSVLIDLFEKEGKKPVRKIYDREIALMKKGKTCDVFALYNGTFHKHTISVKSYSGFDWI